MSKLSVLVLLSLLACLQLGLCRKCKIKYTKAGKKIGRTVIPKDNPQALNALKHAVIIHNARDVYGIFQKHVAVGQIDVEIIEGYLYSFHNVILKDTDCSEASNIPEYDRCQPDPEGQKAKCDLQVYVKLDKPPSEQFKLLINDCEGLETK